MVWTHFDFHYCYCCSSKPRLYSPPITHPLSYPSSSYHRCLQQQLGFLLSIEINLLIWIWSTQLTNFNLIAGFIHNHQNSVYYLLIKSIMALVLLHSSGFASISSSCNFRPSSWSTRSSTFFNSRSCNATVKPSGLSFTPSLHPSSRFSSPPGILHFTFY